MCIRDSTDREFVESANALFTAAILAIKNAAINEEVEIERLSSSIAENRIKKCLIKMHLGSFVSEEKREEEEKKDGFKTLNYKFLIMTTKP